MGWSDLEWVRHNSIKPNEHDFLVESTNTEKRTFPDKTALPEADVKTNRMRGAQNGPNHKEWSLVSNLLFFWKFCFSLSLMCHNPNDPIHTFRTHWI